MKFIRYNPLLLFVFIVGFQCCAQTQPIFNKIDKTQGLSNSRITGIVKEHNGFVWISTQYGLNRYDGHSIKVYSKENSNIISNDISGLYLDSCERLWLTTYGSGLSFYDKEKDSFISYKHSIDNVNSIISNRINTIIEDSDGILWVGTEKGLALFDYNSNKFYNYKYDEQAPLNIISIFEDSLGRLWLGTSSSGLFLFNKQTKSFTRVHQDNQQISSSINAITELNSDRILLGTSNNGLLVVELLNFKTSKFLTGNKQMNDRTRYVRTMFKDSNGNLWIGTDGFGIFEIKQFNEDKPIVTNYMQNSQQPFSLAGNAIYVITEDDDSNLYFGTAWNGISILDINRQSEIIFSDLKGLNTSPVLSVFQNEQYLFLGLDGNGLNIYNYKNKDIDFFDESFINAKYIQKIVQTQNNDIWLGTNRNGLIKFDFKKKRVKQYLNNPDDHNSLSFNDVRDIIEDEQHNLWIATWGGGLNYFNVANGEFSRYSIPNKNLISILKDNNKIWASSYGGGLSVFDIKNKQVENFSFNEQDTTTISSNNLFSILKDSKGYLWIGTSGSGINRMNLETKVVDRFEDVENLKYKTITSIIEDDEYNIWFGCNDGIIKYDYSSSNFKTFSNLSDQYHINSTFKDTSGFLYFGGLKGVLKFDPKKLIDTNQQPEVVIQDVKIFNKKVNIDESSLLNSSLESTREIKLKHFQDVITLEFAALKFPFSQNCEYAIKMENFDENWRNIGKDRTVTYTNLFSGNYTFKVKSRVTGSDWGDAYTSVNIKILKPFWLTWWAYLFYLLVVIYFLYLFRKMNISWAKLKNNLELEKLTHEKDVELYNLKQQFFTNISHEIRTPVTLILSSINRLFDNNNLQSGNQTKAAHTIRRNSNLLLRLVNELLDVRKLESNDIVLNVSKNDFVSFVREIYLSFTDVALDRNIKYNFKPDATNIVMWFDRNQLEKVVFNLISNAFKFTNDNGTIDVIIENNSNDLVLKVKDNGIGISTDNLKKIFNKFYQVNSDHSNKNRGFGLGLAIVKDVVELHKGNISVDSDYKKGSSFEIKLLKGINHFDNLSNKTQDETEKNTTLKKIESKISDIKVKKVKILIVEDNIEIQESLKDLLEQENYEIIQAYDGLDGLKKSTIQLPDLIISDLMMPEMDGIEFSNKIKLNGLTNHIPIIMLTAKTSIEDKIEGFETGADEYIIKPYNEEFLKNRIKNLLKNRKLLKEKFLKSDLVNPKEIAVNSQDQSFLENLYKSLEDNLQANNLKAQLIAENLNMSHSALYKKIKSLTGLTFIEFVRDYRLSIAKQLIEEMGYSVSDACYKVGYSDRKYFSKLFKQKFKKNPSDLI